MSRARPPRRIVRVTCASLVAAAAAADAPAQYSEGVRRVPPAEVVSRVRIDQHLGGPVPLDLVFRDEAGRPVRLADCTRGKPVVLTLVYFGCPSLCTVTLNNLTGALRAISPSAGEDFTILTVSFDPGDTPELAAAKKANYLRQYARPGAERGWRFLTGDQAAIDALTEAAGFRYVRDPVTGQFAHAAAVMVLTPDGTLSHYLYGIEQAPRDLQLALVQASEGRVGTLADRVVLLCYQYDPTSGRYGLAITRSLQAGGLATLLAIGTFVVRQLRRERRLGAAADPGPDAAGGGRG